MKQKVWFLYFDKKKVLLIKMTLNNQLHIIILKTLLYDFVTFAE